jgi:hypothetical protein
MIGHHCAPKIQQFSSIAEVNSFAYSKLSLYKSLLVSEYHSIYPDKFHNFLLHGPYDSSSQPYDFILTLSADYPLFENGFWYLWWLSVTYYFALEFETTKF